MVTDALASHCNSINPTVGSREVVLYLTGTGTVSETEGYSNSISVTLAANSGYRSDLRRSAFRLVHGT